ncbi:MAG TPA: PHP domain-containing protein [Kofleriaceae bacterium]|jgi:DNA polymerase (family 10)
MDSSAVAARLREIAAYLELDGEKFRARAYEKAARSVEATKDLDRLIADGRLTELPRVGESLARTIEELAETGSVGLLDRLRERWPKLLVEMADLPGLGATRARRLHDEIAPGDLEELAEACRAGRVRDIEGFGPALEKKLLKSLETREERTEPLILAEARALSETLAGFARGASAAVDAVAAGSARRFIEVNERLAIAVATRDPAAIVEHMGRHPLVLSIERPAAGGPALARLASGALCEIHFAAPQAFGLTLLRATGSPAHVAAIERRAAAGGARLDELPDEQAVYRAVGLPFLPPEVRDGTDEIAAAESGDDFADLIQLADLRGAVHCHTVYSDGKNTVEQMARAAQALGLEYITITDHSPTAHYAGGLSVERLHQQWAEIAEVQSRVDIRILRGTESDIRAGGELDYPNDVLGQMDIAIASIHSRYRQDEDAMTRRLVTAMRQPLFKIWGHALGRLVMSRDPIPVRFDEVLDAICEGPAAIEINGDPKRLDLDPERARRALGRGVRFVLSCDAHSTEQLRYLELAVAMARRARIRRHHVMNTLSVDEFARAVRPVPS